jgi:hypothetical protein
MSQVSTKLIWVGHAGYVLETGTASVLVDPWLVGRAFHDGWAQYTPPVLADDVLARVTHIWISHEHPDHFSPPTLRSIPPERRATIRVMAAAGNRRLLDFCAGAGYPVESLPVDSWRRLGDDLSVMSSPYRAGDSFLAARTPEGVILNLNDCVVSTRDAAEQIGAEVGEPVRVLLTQFSYANRVGNPSDSVLRQQAATRALERVKVQIDALGPEYVVPFASFVTFCHEENSYMNDSVNRVSDAVRLIERSTAAEAVVLRPGDVWDVDNGRPDPAPRAASYDADLAEATSAGALVHAPPVSLEELLAVGASFAGDLADANGRLGVPLLTAVGYLRPFVVELADLGEKVAVAATGVTRQAVESPPDVMMSADALAFFLRWRFGGSTLLVNARFALPPGGRSERFMRMVRLRDANNVERRWPSIVWGRLVRYVEPRLPARGRPAMWLRRHRLGPLAG